MMQTSLDDEDIVIVTLQDGSVITELAKCIDWTKVQSFVKSSWTWQEQVHESRNL